VLVIGGGYAGVATAYHLLKATATRKTNVVLLEAREACSGATGRNGGHLRPDLTSASVRLSARYGSQSAAAVARFEMDHLDAIARLVEHDKIDCDFTKAASYEVFTTSEQAAAAEKRHSMLREQPAFAELLTAVEYHVGEDAPDRTGVKDAKAYFSSPAAHLSPYKLTMGLLARTLELGLCLKTHTPVLSILKADADAVETGTGGGVAPAKYRITTPHGCIIATKIVVATNAYTSALLPEYAAAIVPCRGLACHISASSSPSAPLSLPRLPTSSLCTRAQQDGLSGYNYIMQRADSTLVVGGAHHTYKHDMASWYDTTDDAGLIHSARSYYCDPPGFAAQAFLGWDQVETRVDHVWTGIMGYSADSLPHVGCVPGREGLFVLAGFNGHGMPVAYLAAKGIAEMVVEGKTYEQTGLPAVYMACSERLMPRYHDILGENGQVGGPGVKQQ
jgi:glycine/D-amino acid oxidase-like deaminating enzyme